MHSGRFAENFKHFKMFRIIKFLLCPVSYKSFRIPRYCHSKFWIIIKHFSFEIAPLPSHTQRRRKLGCTARHGCEYIFSKNFKSESDFSDLNSDILFWVCLLLWPITTWKIEVGGFDFLSGGRFSSWILHCAWLTFKR